MQQFMYSSTCFGRPHAHHQELSNCGSSLWFYLRSVVIAVLLVVVGPYGFMYSSTCFGRPHAHHQELNNCSTSLWFYLRSVVIAVLLVVVGLAGLTTTNTLLSPSSDGKPEAATAVELLMMGLRTPETC